MGHLTSRKNTQGIKNEAIIKYVTENEIDPGFAQRSQFILQNILDRKPKKILDAGCGRGFYISTLSYMDFPEEIVGIDVQNTYLKQARTATAHDKRVKVKKASVYKLPFTDNHFDCVISSEVLEHLEDDHAAVKEISRVLKPNGIFLVTVPHAKFPPLWDPLNWVLMTFFNTHISKDIWWLAGIWADHERLYRDYQLTYVLSENGLKLGKINYIVRWCWPFSHFLLYGIGKNIVEKFGTQEFNRFAIHNMPEKRFAKMLASLVSIPSRLLDKVLPIPYSVNLAIVAKKPGKRR